MVVAEEIEEILLAHIYDRKALESAQYEAIKQKVNWEANQAKNLEEFVSKFNEIWRDGPFSHIRLDTAQQSAEDLANYLDTMNVGPGSVELTWKDNIAVLAVNTMMGTDTIEKINKAYKNIVERNAKALIIDLRRNEGGAFAGMPLVGHLIHREFDAGVFLSQKWTNRNNDIPSLEVILAESPWTGWSIKTFWEDVQNNKFTRIVFEPMEPIFDGLVYVLISQQTASAAEMTADALVTSGRAILIGENTAGEMLSQKMYDLSQSLQLYLPIADYYSARIGRIEGAGVPPNTNVKSEMALDTVLNLARKELGQ